MTSGGIEAIDCMNPPVGDGGEINEALKDLPAINFTPRVLTPKSVTKSTIASSFTPFCPGWVKNGISDPPPLNGTPIEVVAATTPGRELISCKSACTLAG